LQLLPCSRTISEQPFNTTVPAIGRGADEKRASVNLDIGVTAAQQGGKIATIERASESPQDLDVLLGHRLLREPGGFEGCGAMAEDLHLPHVSISDSVDLKVVDHDRDAAFPASATLAEGRQDAIIRRLDELVHLCGEVDPRPSILLPELNELRSALKMLWRVGVRLLVMPAVLDLRIEQLREGFAGQFTAQECVPSVKGATHDLDVLLRHRPRSISPQPLCKE
jgi:hypothetical protein